MRINTDIKTDRLNKAIIMAQQKTGVRANWMVRAAGLFFTQSFAKAMPKSKKKRKTYTFEDTSRRFRAGFRTSHVIYRRGGGKFYARRKNDLREFRTIEYQGLGRQSIIEAARQAGLAVNQPKGIGTRAARVADIYSHGTLHMGAKKPFVQFWYYSDDVLGFPGQRAGSRAIHLASRRLLSYANMVSREQVRAFNL